MRKIKSAEALLFLAPVAVFGLSLLAHQYRTGQRIAPDAIEQQARRLAGPNAVECGRTLINHFAGDYDLVMARDADNARAFAAHKAGRPFFVIHDDSNVLGWGKNPVGGITRHQAIVRTPQGQLYLLSNSTSQSGTGPIQKKSRTTLYYSQVDGSPTPQLLSK